MKRVLFFVVSSLIFLGSSISQTNTNKVFVATVGGGLSFPLTESTFKDTYDYGINGGVTAGYKLSKMCMLRGGIHYNRFPYIELENKKGNFKALVLNAEFLFGAFNVRQKYHPYAVAGTGIYFLNSYMDISGLESSATENDFGFGIGGGITFDLSKHVGIFAEVQYNYFLSNWNTKGYMPVRAGFTFSQ